MQKRTRARQSRSALAIAALAALTLASAAGSAERSSPDMPFAKKRASVFGRAMAYVEVGQGDPIVFLHGNPTSSYLWRNVIPHLEPLGRGIAPDLIGMGDSDKLPPTGEDGDDGRYRYVEHRRYLFALLESLGVREHVTFVVHDWGSALGFEWARRYPGRVRGIAYMEAIVRPMSLADAGFWPRLMFRALRSSLGDFLILRRNLFVERVLPGATQRELTEAELDAYRAPYRSPGESRRPTLTWPRQVPFDGEPADVHAIVAGYSKWLKRSHDLPKLFINAEPGAILTGEAREFVRSWPNQTEVTVAGIHYVQEDSPGAIGRAIAAWLTELP